MPDEQGKMPETEPHKPILQMHDDAEADKSPKKTLSPKAKKEIKSWIIALAEALVIVFLLRTFLFTIIQVKGPSMNDTLYTGDRLAVTIIDVKLHGCDRYDVVICHYPGKSDNYVKRVIGLPGETIESRGGVTYINGEPIDESFLSPERIVKYAKYDFGPVEIPEGYYFVMGDNRDNSNDSRSVGCIAEDQIVGQAQCVLFPFSHWTSLRWSPDEE